jgi:hypothetical protein
MKTINYYIGKALFKLSIWLTRASLRLMMGNDTPRHGTADHVQAQLATFAQAAAARHYTKLYNKAVPTGNTANSAESVTL